MKYKIKILLMLLFIILALPSVQANVFDDIKNIDNGIQEANKKLETLQQGIDELNNKTQEVSENVLIIDDTNKGIQNMSIKLDDISNKLTETLEVTDKFDSFVREIKFLIIIGIAVIAIAILTLISSTFVIVKRKK